MNDKQQLQALGAEHTQRFDADLEWLARNVHEWNEWATHVFKSKLIDKPVWLRALSVTDVFSREQWATRRAELQNKPSWDDAPAWAEWLAQHSSGYWCWGLGEAKPASNGLWYSPEMGTAELNCMGGEVLGDWRDTLERRPNGAKQPATKEDECHPIGTEKAEAVAQHLLALLKSNPRWLDSGTLAEIVELADAELVKRDDAVCGGQRFLDAHWFERGELPPVGTVCLYVISDHRSCEVEITAHTKLGICFVEIGKLGENYVSKTAELHRFRPLQTERQRVASEMVDVMMAIPVSELKTGSEHAMDMALAIYDRFLSKQGGDNADATAPL